MEGFLRAGRPHHKGTNSTLFYAELVSAHRPAVDLLHVLGYASRVVSLDQRPTASGHDPLSKSVKVAEGEITRVEAQLKKGS